MKTAIVAQHASPLHLRIGASPRPDDAGLGELTHILALQGHRVTVYPQKLSRTCRIAPNSAAACASRTSRPARSASGVTRNCWPAYPRSATRCGRAGAVSRLMLCTLSAGPAGSPPRWLPAISASRLCRHSARLASRRDHESADPAMPPPGSDWSWPSADPAISAGAVTQTARLLASKGPQSTHVRNS